MHYSMQIVRYCVISEKSLSLCDWKSNVGLWT